MSECGRWEGAGNLFLFNTEFRKRSPGLWEKRRCSVVRTLYFARECSSDNQSDWAEICPKLKHVTSFVVLVAAPKHCIFFVAVYCASKVLMVIENWQIIFQCNFRLALNSVLLVCRTYKIKGFLKSLITTLKSTLQWVEGWVHWRKRCGHKSPNL